MSTHAYSIDAELVAICSETHMEVYSSTIRIMFGVERGYQATWDDPGQGDVVQFGYAQDRASPAEQFSATYSARITAWAEAWLADHYDDAIEIMRECDEQEKAEAAEHAAGVRADQDRIFGSVA